MCYYFFTYTYTYIYANRYHYVVQYVYHYVVQYIIHACNQDYLSYDHLIVEDYKVRETVAAYKIQYKHNAYNDIQNLFFKSVILESIKYGFGKNLNALLFLF